MSVCADEVSDDATVEFCYGDTEDGAEDEEGGVKQGPELPEGKREFLLCIALSASVILSGKCDSSLEALKMHTRRSRREVTIQ